MGQKGKEQYNWEGSIFTSKKRLTWYFRLTPPGTRVLVHVSNRFSPKCRFEQYAPPS